MSEKPDYRDLIVDCPPCRAKTQLEYMDGATYTDFEALLRSVRAGNVARIYRPFLLGGGKGSTAKQRKIWAERADRVKAKGASLASLDPPMTGHKLTMRAYEEITTWCWAFAATNWASRARIITPERHGRHQQALAAPQRR